MSLLFRTSLTAKKFTELLLTAKSVRKLPLAQTKRFFQEAAKYHAEIPREKKIVGYWLLGNATAAFVGLVIGGWVRLQEASLTMTDWNFFWDGKPHTDADWEREFQKYKERSPDYRYKSQHEPMTLEHFKYVWNLEYIHRMWARVAGLAFLIPCAYFWSKGRFDGRAKTHMVLASTLMVGQGIYGWYMAKSGLDPNLDINKSNPRISPYRLCVHLTGAFLISGLFLWSGLNHLSKPFDHSRIPKIGTLRGLTALAMVAIFTTVTMSAFVSGQSGGLVYNQWPKFGTKWIPDEINSMTPWWRNIFENNVTAQFIHRHSAYFTVAVTTVTWLVGRRMPLSPRARLALNSMLVVVFSQAAAGILTLINYVPPVLAAAHQHLGVALFSCALWLMHEIRRLPK